MNTIFEYYHASMILGNEDGNVYRLVLKNKTATMFLLKNLFLVLWSIYHLKRAAMLEDLNYTNSCYSGWAVQYKTG